jgi:hypothetical protein
MSAFGLLSDLNTLSLPLLLHYLFTPPAHLHEGYGRISYQYDRTYCPQHHDHTNFEVH